jgi:hypothetical protein
MKHIICLIIYFLLYYEKINNNKMKKLGDEKRENVQIGLIQ